MHARTPFLLALAAAAALGLAVVLSERRSGLSGGGAKVFHRERLQGVHPKLVAFLDWWERNGDFPLVVTSGVRTEAEQRALYAQGRTTAGSIVTNAASASQTAHGRGGAIDVYPAVLNATGTAVAAVQDKDWTKFQLIGERAKAFGLAWGGDFKTLRDGPHLEVPGWQSIPMPDGYA